MLHKALTSVEPARPIGNLHASALTNPKGFCPREVCLMKKLGRKPYPQTINAPTRVTFDEGKDTQYRFNNEWMRERMVGNWRCVHCGNDHVFQKVPYVCWSCKHKNFEYQEVVFHHPSGAQGSLDAILDIGKPKLRLIEFKILALDEWEKLKAPLAEHRARCKLYLEIIAGSNHPKKDQIDTDRMTIIYKLRGHGKKQGEVISPFKEFMIHRDITEAKQYLDMALTVTFSKQLDWQFIPEGICATMFETRGKSCPVLKECWSGQYPVQKLP